MADITISTSRQSCEPDCNQLNIIEQTIMNKYSEIDESPSTDAEEPVRGMSAASMKLPLHITKMIQNKLKRKKKLSTSLTSVSDTVNQEKRTRIEGIQLNCRGKLNEELIAAATSSSSPTCSMPAQSQTPVKLERVQSRAPLPSPKVAEKIILLQQCHQTQPTAQQQMAKVPPPRLKRKLEENVSTIQKLNAQTEQMRLEIAELKSHLTAERSAVRVLRAQNESESRKWKNEIKKLQTAMELMRKVKKSKDEACANWAGNSNTSSSANAGAKDANITNHELQRLTNEITTLREANRNLEEKLQISNMAERRKAADLRELKDSYEIRLTQLSKSAKTEISRLLEEIKTKERSIGQLKKETQTLQKQKTNQTTNHNKKDTHATRNAAQHPSEMKKLKDIERNKNNNNNNNNSNVTNKNNTNNEKCFINTTCGEKEFHSMPHEITERILEAHNDVHAYRSKQDHQNSDSDSALSSAPPSISPQPPPTGMEPADIWQTIRNYTKDIEKVQNDLESIQKENESLQKELNLAKEHILESEKTAMEATNNAKMQQQLLDRIKYLEQKENELQEETHELREQNELLEFRILELEESNDKWSLQSNATPSSKNVWNNGGKETDDAIIFTDRSDSGVTSPHSHHHIDDRINVISPCDLNLLDHMTSDDLRRRLSQMIKKPNIDDEDKVCLQHVLAFIQNLDVMSHDSLPSSEESSSLEYIKSRVSDYSSSPRSSDVSPTLLLQKPKSAPPPTGRIVATVLPYSSTVSTPNDSPQRKLRAWHTSSLTESGVFEGDLSESSVYTQTEPEDFACLDSSATEVQKLNRFRERFEEFALKSANAKVPVPSLPSLSPNLSDQKRIQYYKERLDVLESKLLIYESSGDLQAKRLADRLQREIQLENLVKELRDRVDFLEVENSQLEEEKCEFEEAENDTRLRLQRLEVELEILSQRNIELEMSREALQNKLKDCRSESAILRDDLSACQTQVCHLEEDRCRYKENFEFLHSALPALVLFNAFIASSSLDMGNIMESPVVPPPEPARYGVMTGRNTCDLNAMTEEGFRRESQNLREEIRCLKRQIGDLNSRHTEALACADGFWEDLEKTYNEKLMASKAKEECLKQKIRQLEGCLQDDSRAANEKICQLEDGERELKQCLQKVSRDHREIQQEHELITEEYHRVKEKYDKLKEHVDGPIKEAMERERAQNKSLKEELGYLRRTSCETEMRYRNELDLFQVQLDKLHKELMQIQVTNSELREEVCTLEKEVVNLQQAKKEDVDRIRCLADEVRTKEDMCAVLEKRVEALLASPYHNQRQGQCSGIMSPCSAAPSLAQELNGSPVKRIKMEEPRDLESATKNLGTVLSNIRDCSKDIPSHKQFRCVANDVKKLAETILASKSTCEQKKKIATMNRCKRQCHCHRHTVPVLKDLKDSKQTSTQKPPASCPSYQTDTDTFYDANDTFYGFPDGYPSPTTACKLKESNSLTKLLQKICDPDQFRLALRNIMENAENLLTTIEGIYNGSSEKCLASITTIMGAKVPFLTRSADGDGDGALPKIEGSDQLSRVDQRERIDRAERVDLGDGRQITIEPIAVSIPLTLYVRPNVVQEWCSSIPLDEESLGGRLESKRTIAREVEPFRLGPVSVEVPSKQLCEQPCRPCKEEFLFAEDRMDMRQVAEKESVPEPVLEIQPEPLMIAVPKREAKLAPQREADFMPQREAKHVPQREADDIPKQEAKLVPERDPVRSQYGLGTTKASEQMAEREPVRSEYGLGTTKIQEQTTEREPVRSEYGLGTTKTQEQTTERGPVRSEYGLGTTKAPEQTTEREAVRSQYGQGTTKAPEQMAEREPARSEYSFGSTKATEQMAEREPVRSEYGLGTSNAPEATPRAEPQRKSDLGKLVVPELQPKSSKERRPKPMPLPAHMRLKDLSDRKYGLGPLQECALPQQKDLDLCAPCTCNQCPVFNAEQRVICPQNCGCCTCPWQDDSEVNANRSGSRICSCIPSRTHCECPSNYVLCPCRLIAECRYAELYGAADIYADKLEAESSVASMSKDQPRATEDDRYGDHTNLSNQPNIQAYAGLVQQPAGPQQKQQQQHQENAKDSECEDDYFNANDNCYDTSSTDQYYTPRGSFPSSCQSCSRWLNVQPSEQSSKPETTVKISFHTPEGSFDCLCDERCPCMNQQAACVTTCVEEELKKPASILKISFLEKGQGAKSSVKKKEEEKVLHCPCDNNCPCGGTDCIVYQQGEEIHRVVPKPFWFSTSEQKKVTVKDSDNCLLNFLVHSGHKLCPCGDANCKIWQHGEESQKVVSKPEPKKLPAPPREHPGNCTQNCCKTVDRPASLGTTTTSSCPSHVSEASSLCTYGDTDESYLLGEINQQTQTKPKYYSSSDARPWSDDTLQACCQWILKEATKYGSAGLYPDDVDNGVKACSDQTGTISRTSSSKTRNDSCPSGQQQQTIHNTTPVQSYADQCYATSKYPPQRKQISVQSNSTVGPSYSFPVLPYRSLPTGPTDEKVLPLLESIFEVLQCIREEQLHPHSPRVEGFELPKQIDLEDAFFDIPPPPPPPTPPQSQNIAQQIRISSAPPFNIFITPMSPQQSNVTPFNAINYDIPEQPICGTPRIGAQWLDTPRYADEIKGMEVMEPPVRDIDIQADQCLEVKTQRKLIPVDMDLLRTDDDFDWKPHKEPSDLYLSSAASSPRPGVCKEVQVNGEDLPCRAKKSDTKAVSFGCELTASKEVQVNETLLAEVTPLKAQFLQFSEDANKNDKGNCPYIEAICQHRALKAKLLDKPRYSSDSVSNESITCIETYSQPDIPQKMCIELAKKQNYAPSNSTDCIPNRSANCFAACNQKAPDPKPCTCADTTACREGCSGRTEKVHSAQILVLDRDLSEDTLIESAETSNESCLACVPPTKVPPLDSNCLTKSDVGTDRPEFCDEVIALANRSCCSSCRNCRQSRPKPETDEFVDSILSDLEVMKECRQNSVRSFPRIPTQPVSLASMGWQKPSVDFSYPVTIEKVQELGTNSLFVKWRVHTVTNIAGYEIFLDGTLTNRYFSSIHRAAVICQVDLHCPHRITLRAQPIVLKDPPPSSPRAKDKWPLSTNNPGACCPQPDGSVWYPSVFHFEPNVYRAPAITDSEEQSCAHKC